MVLCQEKGICRGSGIVDPFPIFLEAIKKVFWDEDEFLPLVCFFAKVYLNPTDILFNSVLAGTL